MYATREELSRYLGREAGLDVPIRLATENRDLSADLKRALADTRYNRTRSEIRNDEIKTWSL
jgi:hypothetical protein